MADGGRGGRTRQVLALGTTQTVAWASSVYLPAVLAVPMGADLGLPPSRVFAAFSWSLLVMALCGPAVGRAIDRHGGRGVLCLSSLVLGLGLAGLGLVRDGTGLFLAWSLIGVGMALGLYDAAFATLVRLHGLKARGAITGITLLGGFASTVGWPLSAWLAGHWDWRVACWAWAGLHLCLALPLNAWFIPRLPASLPGSAGAGPEEGKAVLDGGADGVADGAGEAPGRRRDFWLVALFGACTAFVTSAMAAHLPAFLVATGASAAMALAAAALVGPAQVLARLFEFFAASRLHLSALASARLATALHPLGGLGLLGLGGVPAMAAAFACLHGAGNGLITIARGTLPLALFGPRGYGARQGWLAVSQRGMQAAAPFSFALVLEHWGTTGGLCLTIGVSLLALGALLRLRLE